MGRGGKNKGALTKETFTNLVVSTLALQEEAQKSVSSRRPFDEKVYQRALQAGIDEEEALSIIKEAREDEEGLADRLSQLEREVVVLRAEIELEEERRVEPKSELEKKIAQEAVLSQQESRDFDKDLQKEALDVFHPISLLAKIETAQTNHLKREKQASDLEQATRELQEIRSAIEEVSQSSIESKLLD